MRSLLIGAALLAVTLPVAHAQQSRTDTGAAESARAEDGKYLVFFELDRATLTRDGRRVIGEAAREYQRSGAARVALSGHADRSASEAYNLRLSERRVEAVRRELVRLGVPAEAIAAVAEGEGDPLVQTADGVREPRNRRVEIEVPMTAAPAERAPAEVADEEPAPPERVAEAPGTTPKLALSVGGIYGHNFQETDKGSENRLAGGELGVAYSIAPALAFSFEQAAFRTFDGVDDGWGGRSVAGLDLQVPFLGLSPYVGANVGGVYGEGVQDGFVVGPEVGLKVGLGQNAFLYGKAAYDYQLRNEDWDDGIALGGAGVGFRF